MLLKTVIREEQEVLALLKWNHRLIQRRRLQIYMIKILKAEIWLLT